MAGMTSQRLFLAAVLLLLASCCHSADPEGEVPANVIDSPAIVVASLAFNIPTGSVIEVASRMP